MSVKSAPTGAQERATGGKYDQTDVLVSNARNFPGDRRVLGTQGPGSDHAANSNNHNPNGAAEIHGADVAGRSFGYLYRDVC